MQVQPRLLASRRKRVSGGLKTTSAATRSTTTRRTGDADYDGDAGDNDGRGDDV